MFALPTALHTAPLTQGPIFSPDLSLLLQLLASSSYTLMAPGASICDLGVIGCMLLASAVSFHPCNALVPVPLHPQAVPRGSLFEW